MNSSNSQTQRITAYLLNGGKLTALSALKKFGCFRLASRITEIRQHYKVDTQMIKVRGKRIAQYKILI